MHYNSHHSIIWMTTCLVTWQQHCALSFGRSQSQLVKSHDLTACLQDPAAGTISDPQSADLWDNKQDMRTILETVIYNIQQHQQVISATKEKNGGFTLSLGISWILTSSVTDPTTTAILFSRPGSFILRIWSQWKQSLNISMHNHMSEQLTTGLTHFQHKDCGLKCL